MNRTGIGLIYRVLLLLLLICAPSLHAVELRLFDNSRVNASIEGVADSGLRVTLMDGSEQTIPFDNILTIQFRGRGRRLLLSGAQELWFVNGDRVRGRFEGIEDDRVLLASDTMGTLPFEISALKGFVSIPQIGRAGREAQELVESREGPNPFLDVLLEQRGSRHEGAIQALNRDGIEIDREDMQRAVQIKTQQLAGARFADAGRKPEPAFPSDIVLRFWSLDGSVFDGRLDRIEIGRWLVRPLWDEKTVLPVVERELALVQIMNAKRLYLSQLLPIKVSESTRYAPKQPYRINRNCKGTTMTIGEVAYPWGIGVHASSELTFKINGRFETFHSFVGIDGVSGHAGSAVFSVLCDGKEAYRSPLVKGGDGSPRAVEVSVKGAQELTLKVEDGDGLDIGDLANWAAPQLVR